MEIESPVGQRWKVMHGALDERQRRLLVAVEAKVLGRGGVSAVAVATGVSRTTIAAGIQEIEALMSADPSVAAPLLTGTRQAGAGRKKIETKDVTLLPDLLALVDSSMRGDPESPLRWTCKSLRNLADELKAKGHTVSHVVVGKLLKQQDYSLQGNVKVLEGNQSPDRNAQFEHINASVAAALQANQPVISVDTKKKELVGACKNAGQEWLPSGEPVKVKVHDFIDKELRVGRVQRPSPSSPFTDNGSFPLALAPGQTSFEEAGAETSASKSSPRMLLNCRGCPVNGSAKAIDLASSCSGHE